MECEEFKTLAVNYISHRLSEDLVQQVEEHLCICENCRDYLAKIMEKREEDIPSSQVSATEVNTSNFTYIILVLGILIVAGVVFLFIKYYWLR